MIKEFQQELKDKIKEGVKPSHLKKSKSLNDLPTIPKSPPLKHSHSTSEIPLIEPTELEDQISVLELKLETKDRELEDKEETIKDFRKAFQKADEEIKKTKQELDNSLEARYEALKQFGKLAQKLKALRKELEENMTQSTDELVEQDEIITKLRTNHQKAQTRIQELEQDLQLAQRLTKLKDFYPSPENDFNYLKYSFYGLALLIFALWITTKKQK